MKYNYNGVTINLKDKACRLWDNISGDIYPQANLYIRINNRCNANCRFCEYHGKETEFDYIEFDKVLADLENRKILSKIQITGGEPTLDDYKLKKVVHMIRQYFPWIFIGINSNGYNLSLLEELLTSSNENYRIDNVAISRHHYIDDINKSIFGTNTVPDENSLRAFVHSVKDKLGNIDSVIHFSCNLIKGYIYDIESIKKYLEWASNLGVTDFGFVTLMPINKYAADSSIDFGTLGLEDTTEFLNYKQYTKEIDTKICCKCANYLYYCPKTNNILDIYGRYVVENKDTTGQLVFDGTNLKSGFNGDIIRIGG